MAVRRMVARDDAAGIGDDDGDAAYGDRAGADAAAAAYGEGERGVVAADRPHRAGTESAAYRMPEAPGDLAGVADDADSVERQFSELLSQEARAARARPAGRGRGC